MFKKPAWSFSGIPEEQRKVITGALNHLRGRGGWHPKGGEIIADLDSGFTPHALRWFKDGKVIITKFEQPGIGNAFTWEDSLARALELGKG